MNWLAENSLGCFIWGCLGSIIFLQVGYFQAILNGLIFSIGVMGTLLIIENFKTKRKEGIRHSSHD